MHMWLADQVQSSVPAWLTSPVVALLGLIATVISILQGLISTTKWFIKRTDKPGTRRRFTVSVGVCIIASIVVLAPFTWEAMAREDVKVGDNPLWLAELYPVVIFAPLIICAMFYFRIKSFNWKDRPTYSAFILAIISLAFPTFLYDVLHSSIWERCLVSATPGLTIGMLIVTYIAHLLPRAEPSASADAQEPPSATTPGSRHLPYSPSSPTKR